MAALLTGITFWTSGIAGVIGAESVNKRIVNGATGRTTDTGPDWRAKVSEGSITKENLNQPQYSRVAARKADTDPPVVAIRPVVEIRPVVCEKPDRTYLGLVSGSSCDGQSKLVTANPGVGFLGLNKKRSEQYEVAVAQSISKTKLELSRKAEEERERKAELEKWGPFFADFEVRQQAKKMCNDYAFSMTRQNRSWFYDDRTDFDIRVDGDRVWVGGPITVKVKDGNIDGSDFRYQKGVDCYWSKNATSLEGGKITVE